MQALRTPDERFKNLPNFPYEPRYMEVASPRGGTLRLHYIDEGPRDGKPIWLQHGLPAWSFHFRKMIPILVAAGYRVLAPDLMGHGRSDKPTYRPDYTVENHIDWIREWLVGLDLTNVTALVHDWGVPVGLGVIARESERLSAVLATNGVLFRCSTQSGTLAESNGSIELTEKGVEISGFFADWFYISQTMPDFIDNCMLVCLPTFPSDSEAQAGYHAPFPDYTYEAGIRHFPLLNPFSPNHPTHATNEETWQGLSTFEKPFLTVYEDGDFTKGAEKPMLKFIPGTTGMSHVMMSGVSHFSMEDVPEEFCELLIELATMSG